MDFSLTEEQQALQDSARAYATERLPQVARHCEERDEARSRDLVREFAGMGFLKISIVLQVNYLLHARRSANRHMEIEQYRLIEPVIGQLYTAP